MADVLLNRPSDSAGHDILLNTSRELIMWSDSAGLAVITGGVDSNQILSGSDSSGIFGIIGPRLAGGGGGGASQADLDSANALIVSLRADLDSAEAAAASSGSNEQRWIS